MPIQSYIRDQGALKIEPVIQRALDQDIGKRGTISDFLASLDELAPTTRWTVPEPKTVVPKQAPARRSPLALVVSGLVGALLVALAGGALFFLPVGLLPLPSFAATPTPTIILESATPEPVSTEPTVSVPVVLATSTLVPTSQATSTIVPTFAPTATQVPTLTQTPTRVRTRVPRVTGTATPGEGILSTPTITGLDGLRAVAGSGDVILIHFTDRECDVTGGKWQGTEPPGTMDIGASTDCTSGVGTITFARNCQIPGNYQETIVLTDAQGNTSPGFSFNYICRKS